MTSNHFTFIQPITALCVHFI